MEPYYRDDAVTLYHGDCREVLPSLAADVVVTDPPYGVGLVSFDDDFSVSPVGLDLAPGVRAAVFMSPRRVLEFANALTTWTFERLLWMHKMADLSMPWRGWCMNSEAILVFSRDRAGWPTPETYRSDLYNVAPWGKVGHPNAKPLTVMRDLVTKLAAPSHVVLDPFAGSGSTLRAAKDCGRLSIGIEIEERYCEIAARRLCQEVLDFGASA